MKGIAIFGRQEMMTCANAGFTNEKSTSSCKFMVVAIDPNTERLRNAFASQFHVKVFDNQASFCSRKK
jgi:hypothetical protein